MKLTEKCKEDFEKWLERPLKEDEHEGQCTWIGEEEATLYNIWTTEYFYQLPFSMKYGVYVDFFDSVGIYIKDRKISNIKRFMCIIEDEKGRHLNNYIEQGFLKTRKEVRTEAIENANEIYNNQ